MYSHLIKIYVSPQIVFSASPSDSILHVPGYAIDDITADSCRKSFEHIPCCSAL